MGQLQQWLDEDWVRIGSDGSILGSCGSKKEAEGKPKCLPRKKAEGMSKEARAKLVARKRKKDPNPNRKGKPIMVSNKLSGGGPVVKRTIRGQGIVMTNRLRQNKNMAKLQNPKKADLNKDGKINSYEEKRAKAIEKAMAAQNRVKKKNGGFTAKGCGSVMDQKRKVTTISQEYKMYKKTKGYAIGGKRKGIKKGGGVMKTKGYATGGVVKPKGKAGGGAMNTKGYKRGGKV